MHKHFMEIKELIKGPNTKNWSYRAGYNMKNQFIKEEIKRCSEQKDYVAYIMQLAEDRKQTLIEQNEDAKSLRLEKRIRDSEEIHANYLKKQEKCHFENKLVESHPNTISPVGYQKRI